MIHAHKKGDSKRHREGKSSAGSHLLLGDRNQGDPDGTEWQQVEHCAQDSVVSMLLIARSSLQHWDWQGLSKAQEDLKGDLGTQSITASQEETRSWGIQRPQPMSHSKVLQRFPHCSGNPELQFR